MNNHQPDALPESSLEAPQAAPRAVSPTRPVYWSVRRELWEHRSILLAPLAVAALVLFASLIGLPRRLQTLASDPAKLHAAVVRPLSMAPAPIMLATFLVGIFYCLDALYGERRDRSILFWKSLPVSDRTAVLSKASIPLVVLPLIAFVLGLATQLLLLLASSAALLGGGGNPGALWAEFRFFQGLLIMLYGLAVHALWFAPIYAWLLLVSVWARRAPVLWAALPPFAIAVVEKIAFGSSRFLSLLGYRVAGAMAEAFEVTRQGGHAGDVDRLTQLDPVRFLASPGLWIGLMAAAAFIAAAVRMRRYREPI